MHNSLQAIRSKHCQESFKAAYSMYVVPSSTLVATCKTLKVCQRYSSPSCCQRYWLTIHQQHSVTQLKITRGAAAGTDLS
jgi:hypothetical protein